MTQPQLNQEKLNQSINASREEHSLTHPDSILPLDDQVLKGQVTTDYHGDEVIAKLEAPMPNQKEKQENQPTANTPLHTYMDQHSMSKNQNKENHMSYTEDLSRPYALSHDERENQNQRGENLADRNNFNPHLERYENQNVVPLVAPAQPQPELAHNVYYSYPVHQNVGPRRRVPACAMVLIVLAFVCLMVGIITLGVISYRRKQAVTRAPKKRYVDPYYDYVAVAPTIVPPLDQSQTKPSGKDLPQIIPSTSGASKGQIVTPLVSKYQPFEESKSTVESPVSSQPPISLPRGNRITCPYNQLLVNGNCLSCGKGEEWLGLDCIPTSEIHKHMRRRY